MTHFDGKIFTDSIKDVIGDEPVLDQFDTFYEASFYGSSQDDYVTGSIVSVSTSYVGNKVQSRLSVASVPRGRAFSKYYSGTESILESAFGTAAVAQNPSLSYRLVPGHERASRTAYRILQCYDQSERYYDSCLPDLPTCFKVNDAQVWTTSNVPDRWLSPYNSFTNKTVGYMFFNTYESNRSSDGFSNDPLVNNEWTWSYPYETKYSPLNRTIKTTDALGFNSTTLKATQSGPVISNLTQSTTPVRVEGLVPLLPGKTHHPRDVNSHVALGARDPMGGITPRNSFRSYYTVVSSSVQVPSEFTDPRFDDKYGFAYTIPADVKLNSKTGYADYVTGTMSLDETVKFLFGFGDVNSMTYGSQQFLSGNKTYTYNERFEIGTATRTFAHSLGTSGVTSTGSFHKFDWSHSPTKAASGWSTVRSSGYPPNNRYVDTTNVFGSGSIEYNYVSASFLGVPTTGTPVKGLFWRYNFGTVLNNDIVLMSDTATGFDGGLSDGYPSLAILDVTSSYPWDLKYDRGIVSAGDPISVFSILWVYFSGIPAIASHDLDPLGITPIATLEILTGNIKVTPGTGYDVMKTYTTRVDGIGDNQYTKQYQADWPYPLDPGAYRLVFAYIPQGAARFDPQIAAVDNIQLIQYKEDAFLPDEGAQKLGCNNYPRFKTTVLDYRANPLVTSSLGYPSPQSDVTRELYRGYHFGVGPEIRGWKYGLYSGLPMHTKTVFRRGRYGQLRDMLEQRQYTKFVSVDSSPLDNDAIVFDNYTKHAGATISKTGGAISTGPSPVEVNFVRQRYSKDARGIGYIYNEKVKPELTVSQNLSSEVTSSLPYFDGVAKLRKESDLQSIANVTTVGVSIGTGGITVT